MNNICVSYGDGIGPEIMDATLKILRAANFQFNADEILLGEQAYAAGYLNGVEDSAWDKISKNKVLLKAPLTTPEGGGFKSEPFEHKCAGYAMAYAKDLVVGEKVEIKDLLPTADKIYNWLLSKKVD